MGLPLAGTCPTAAKASQAAAADHHVAKNTAKIVCVDINPGAANEARANCVL